jgi:uncharacterized lipoprotein YajG
LLPEIVGAVFLVFNRGDNMRRLFVIALVLASTAMVTACASGPQKFSSNPELAYLETGAVVQT